MWLVRVAVVLLVSIGASSFSSATGFETGSPHSSVQTLTEETFPKAIQDSANSLWLLKFYAPWCGHCKRLAPVLDEVAPLVTGKMAIGKIDCVVQKALCNQFSIRGYPTLKYSRDGDIHDFPGGGRTVEEIMKFARKMSAPAVSICATHDDALQLASTTQDGIVFVGHDPDVKGATRSEKLQSTHLTRVLQQVARLQQADATFCLTSPTADLTKFGRKQQQGGFIAKLETGGAPLVMFEQEITTPNVLNFVKEYNVPLVAELGPANFHKIGRNGKRLVVGAIFHEREIGDMKKKLMDYALLTSNNTYYFGWMNGKKWHKFLQQFNVKKQQLPQVFILDVPQKVYWQDEHNSYNTDNNIQDFIQAVESGKIEPQTVGGRKQTTGGIKGMMYEFESLFLQYVPWSVVALIAVLVLITMLILPKPDELRPPYTKKEVKTTEKKIEEKKPKETTQETTTTTEAATTAATTEEESKKVK
jgi:protein disulfide-isomerase-like protein